MKNDRTARRIDKSTHRPTVAALTCVYSPDQGLEGRVRVLDEDPVVLGRQPGDDGIAFADAMASRRHATISWDADRGRHLVHDEGSQNGSQVGGRDIQREILEPSDTLRLGDTLFIYNRFDLEAVGWSPPPDALLVGSSPPIARVHDQLDRVAASDLSVLVLGETGTGKELVAQELHRRSGRSGPFVPLNCASIPADLLESELYGHVRGAFSGADRDKKGLFQEAGGGTVLLDEVGELDPGHQAKLLRAIETRSVRPVGAGRSVDIDVRFVSATHRDLHADAEAGRFRADLLARLDQWNIALPPLADRREDIIPITRHLIGLHGDADRHKLTGDVAEALLLHPWTYNVRELVNVVRRALVHLPDGGDIEPAHLPESLREAAAQPEGEPPPTDLPPEGEEPTGAELARLLAHYEGVVAEVARHTGRERVQVYRWLKKHGLDADSYRDP